MDFGPIDEALTYLEEKSSKLYSRCQAREEREAIKKDSESIKIIINLLDTLRQNESLNVKQIRRLKCVYMVMSNIYQYYLDPKQLII